MIKSLDGIFLSYYVCLIFYTTKLNTFESSLDCNAKQFGYLNCLYRDMGIKFEFPESHIPTYEYTKWYFFKFSFQVLTCYLCDIIMLESCCMYKIVKLCSRTNTLIPPLYWLVVHLRKTYSRWIILFWYSQDQLLENLQNHLASFLLKWVFLQCLNSHLQLYMYLNIRKDSKFNISFKNLRINWPVEFRRYDVCDHEWKQGSSLE